jgi:hypothetical protein
MAKSPTIRLPQQWSRHVKSGILHAIALASTAMVAAHGRAARRRRLAVELEQARQEIALLREELETKLRGFWLLPRRDCLPLNASAFAWTHQLAGVAPSRSFRRRAQLGAGYPTRNATWEPSRRGSRET